MPRLRIYPHALREANAYYSPQKKALLFGYFPASTADPGHNLPGGTVFTCLSHDIIAHETTHALLDGLHRRFIEPSNPDALAFHEAFADIVALFQHFSFPEVLRHQIARHGATSRPEPAWRSSRSSSARRSAATAPCATPSGRSTRRPASGSRKEPDPADLQTDHEPHDRGAILVAAVFDAFLDHLQGAHRRPAADRDRRHGRAAARATPPRPRRPPGAARRRWPPTTS